MTPLKFPACTILALVGAWSLMAIADPLDERVGAEQAREMGLQKLSAEERDQLARWIERQLEGRPLPVNTPTVSFAFDGVTVQARVVPAATAPVAAPTLGSAGAFGLEQDKVDGGIKELHARIVGAFTGWQGDTQFKLDNGQVWRQSRTGTYRYKATDPEVVIEKGAFGYKLRLVDTKRSIAVRRVK